MKICSSSSNRRVISYFIPLISLGERDLFFDKEANKKPEKRLGREGILSDLIESIQNIYKKTQDAPNVCSNTVALSSSFSQALCLLHRLEDIDKGCTLKNRRVLFIHGAEDVPGQYVPMMNASFCAKKMNVLVDACVLNEKDSNFLQQAASISGGVYYNPSEELERMKKPALSQYLVNIFLANPKTRKIMQLPKTHTSALKVSCFLSQRPIDMGFVCSVCLSIFSSKMEKCAICETVFQNTRSLKRKTLIG